MPCGNGPMKAQEFGKEAAPLLRKESWAMLVVGFVFGLAAVVFVPPFVTYDGPNHFLRALQVSEGEMRPVQFSERAVGGILPRSHADFENTVLWNYYLRLDRSYMDRRQWEDLSNQEVSVTGSRPVEFTNTAVYSPVNYAFQACGMWLAAGLSPSPLLANWIGCLFNLAGYLLLVVIAIECAPRFQRGILLLASSPLIVVQAASLSADAINFALPLAVVAIAWRLREGEANYPRLEFAGLLGLGILVVLLKPVLAAVLLCLLFVPAARLGCSSRERLTVLGLYFFVAGCTWLGWNSTYFDTDIARWFDPSRPPMAVHKQWLLENPLRFARPFLSVLRHDLVAQWPHLYGDPGDWVSRASYPVNAALSFVFLAGFMGCGSWERRTDGSWALALFATALALIFLTALAIWMAFGAVRMDFVPGMVGRYLLVPALVCGIAWAECFHHGFGKLRNGLFWTALAANAAGLAVIVVPVAIRTW
jgi:Predicted membrane protein (DUF2142)